MSVKLNSNNPLLLGGTNVTGIEKRSVGGGGMVRLDRKYKKSNRKSNRKSHSALKTVKISTVKNPLRRQSDPTWYAIYVPWYGSCCETNSVFGLDLPALFMPTQLSFFAFEQLFWFLEILHKHRQRRKRSFERLNQRNKKAAHTSPKKRILF